GFMLQSAYGTTSYDPDTRTLTFVPQQPLVHGSRYQLRLGTTITDLAGNAFAGATIAFNTYVNAPTREVGRLPTGIPEFWFSYALDANGRIIKQLFHSGPGVDGIWLNDNDQISSRSDNTFT